MSLSFVLKITTLWGGNGASPVFLSRPGHMMLEMGGLINCLHESTYQLMPYIVSAYQIIGISKELHLKADLHCAQNVGVKVFWTIKIQYHVSSPT